MHVLTFPKTADFSTWYRYDLEANPTRIKRMGLTDVDTYGVLNDIRVDYRTGRPRSVADAADVPILEGSLTGSAVEIKVTHEYDANGNLIKDATRGIDSISYNVLNLPEWISFSNGYRLGYVYRSDGVKLREIRQYHAFNPATGRRKTDNIYYFGPYEQQKSNLHRLNLPGGYITLGDSVYHHYLADYQGNILGVINTRTRQVEQRTDYYPYGMPHGNASGAGLNSRKYSGKELITFAGYDAMDYHARWRPTSLPLFTTPDPMAEKYYPLSLYAYCGGDPVNNVDPSGMRIDPASVEEFNSCKTVIESKRNELIKSISDIENSGIDSPDLMKVLNDRVTGINKVLSNLYRIENSSQLYQLNYLVNKTGGLTYNKQTGAISINYANIVNFVHESTHAGQFESGDIGFVAESGGTIAQDIFDEVDAYRLQFLFKPASVIQLNLDYLIDSVDQITSNWVQSLKDINGTAIYAPGNRNNVGINIVNAQSNMDELVRAYPNLVGIYSGLPPGIRLNEISGFIFK